jgi:(4S)-4-hydroxy-5-phosphonooxypentane-2,3-dione isomerase
MGQAWMIAKWVRVKVRPSQRRRFLRVMKADALGSVRLEPGCLRFDVLEDQGERNVFYLYEVYTSPSAVEEHEKTPHFLAWMDAKHELVTRVDVTLCRPRVPEDSVDWRERRRVSASPRGPARRRGAGRRG